MGGPDGSLHRCGWAARRYRSYLAAGEGATQMYSWAGTENGPAIGFATGFGFRVTSHRRPVTSGDHALGDTEIALVLPLEDDPHIVPNATAGRLRR